MITIMAKTESLMTPRSRPTLRMTSSISPRVFMRMPMALRLNEVMSVIWTAVNPASEMAFAGLVSN